MLFQTDIDVEAFTTAVVDRLRNELDRAVDATGRSLLCIGPVNIEDPPAPKGMREVGVVSIDQAVVERREREDGKNFRPLDEPGGLGVRRVQLVVYLVVPLFTRKELAAAGASAIGPLLLPEIQLPFDLVVDRMVDGRPCLRASYEAARPPVEGAYGTLLTAVDDTLRPLFDANPICEPVELSALNDILGFDATTGWTRGGVSVNNEGVMAVRIEFAEVAPLRAPELSWPQFFEGNLHWAFAIPPLGGLPPAGIRTVVDAEAIRARVVRDITPSLSDPRLRDASVTVNIDHAAPAKISTTVRGRIEESVGPLGCSVRFVASASSTLSVAAPDLLVERTEGEVDRDNWDVLWCSTKIGLAGGLAYMPFGLMIGFAIGFAQWFVESLVLISRARPPIRPPAGSSPTPATGPLKKKVLRTIKTCEKIEPEDKDFGYECRYRYVVVEEDLEPGEMITEPEVIELVGTRSFPTAVVLEARTKVVTTALPRPRLVTSALNEPEWSLPLPEVCDFGKTRRACTVFPGFPPSIPPSTVCVDRIIEPRFVIDVSWLLEMTAGTSALHVCGFEVIDDPEDQFAKTRANISLVWDEYTRRGSLRFRLFHDRLRPSFLAAPYAATIVLRTTGGVRVLSVPIPPLTAEVQAELLGSIDGTKKLWCTGALPGSKHAPKELDVGGHGLPLRAGMLGRHVDVLGRPAVGPGPSVLSRPAAAAAASAAANVSDPTSLVALLRKHW